MQALFIRSIAILGVALLAACAQQPAPPLAARQSAAIDANRKAEQLFRGGDYAGAARNYLEALRIAQSVEDAEGIAANAINLSIVYQRQGKLGEARAALAPVLEQPRLAFAPERLAQVALRRAVLDLEDKRSASAAEWLDKAQAACASQSCALTASIHNLRGQLALDAGRSEAAAASANLALAASRGAGNKLEAANALRLLGNASIGAGDAAAAQAPLAEALAIDRELALPRKIFLDLVALGRASGLAGDKTAARVFYERARAVGEADRDAGEAAAALELIRALEANP
jgi:tetratricopeptide (TPR) repeat protein